MVYDMVAAEYDTATCGGGGEWLCDYFPSSGVDVNDLASVVELGAHLQERHHK